MTSRPAFARVGYEDAGRAPAGRRVGVLVAGLGDGRGGDGVRRLPGVGVVVLTVFVLAANTLPALLLSPIVGKLATGRDPRTVDAIGQVGKIAFSVVLAGVAAELFVPTRCC